MSMPCSTKDCFMCQMENNEIKEMFYVDNNRQSKTYSKSKTLKILNVMIGVVSLLLLFNILISRKNKNV
jgi:hypothetical protein